jgi:AraC-like DNA-binding protein
VQQNAGLEVTPGADLEVTPVKELAIDTPETNSPCFVEQRSPSTVSRDIEVGVGLAMNSRVGVRWSDAVLDTLQADLEPKLVPLIRFCLEHAREPIGVEDIARWCGVHRRALEYRLAQAGLPPPNRVVAWARLVQAAWRFSRDPSTIATVAEASGYCSPNAMRKSFQRFGLRLSDVRRLGGYERVVLSLFSAVQLRN